MTETPQRLAQWLKQGDIRQTLGGFPFGDGFAADADLFSQLRLGQTRCFPQTFDGGSCDISVHVSTPFPGKAYHEMKNPATCAS